MGSWYVPGSDCEVIVVPLPPVCWCKLTNIALQSWRVWRTSQPRSDPRAGHGGEGALEESSPLSGRSVPGSSPRGGPRLGGLLGRLGVVRTPPGALQDNTGHGKHLHYLPLPSYHHPGWGGGPAGLHLHPGPGDLLPLRQHQPQPPRPLGWCGRHSPRPRHQPRPQLWGSAQPGQGPRAQDTLR